MPRILLVRTRTTSVHVRIPDKELELLRSGDGLLTSAIEANLDGPGVTIDDQKTCAIIEKGRKEGIIAEW